MLLGGWLSGFCVVGWFCRVLVFLQFFVGGVIQPYWLYGGGVLVCCFGIWVCVGVGRVLVLLVG